MNPLIIRKIQAALLCPDKVVCDLILESILSEVGLPPTLGVVHVSEFNSMQTRLKELEERKDELPTSGA